VEVDAQPWEEVLFALYKFKLDAAKHGSDGCQHYLNQMLNANIRTAKEKIDLIN